MFVYEKYTNCEHIYANAFTSDGVNCTIAPLFSDNTEHGMGDVQCFKFYCGILL